MAQDTAWLEALFVGYDAEASEARTNAMRQSDNAARAQDAARMVRQRCTKCGGTGTLPQYLHRHHGTCYRCGGSGRLA